MEALHEIDAVDRAVYAAVAASPTPSLDRGLSTLSRVADKSVLWMLIAGGLAVRPGRTRTAAVAGLASIGVASATVNIVAKRVLPRERPDRLGSAVPTDRHV